MTHKSVISNCGHHPQLVREKALPANGSTWTTRAPFGTASSFFGMLAPLDLSQYSGTCSRSLILTSPYASRNQNP
eukprot:1768007-Pyramimonas_sp.AAC.1